MFLQRTLKVECQPAGQRTMRSWIMVGTDKAKCATEPGNEKKMMSQKHKIARRKNNKTKPCYIQGTLWLNNRVLIFLRCWLRALVVSGAVLQQSWTVGAVAFAPTVPEDARQCHLLERRDVWAHEGVWVCVHSLMLGNSEQCNSILKCYC